jgi:hypothetical protein
MEECICGHPQNVETLKLTFGWWFAAIRTSNMGTPLHPGFPQRLESMRIWLTQQLNCIDYQSWSWHSHYKEGWMDWGHHRSFYWTDCTKKKPYNGETWLMRLWAVPGVLCVELRSPYYFPSKHFKLSSHLCVRLKPNLIMFLGNTKWGTDRDSRHTWGSILVHPLIIYVALGRL